MRSPAEFSIRHSVLVNLMVLVLLVSGVYLYSTMTRELMPEIELEFVMVTTVYPGASPETIEESITTKIEREIADVDGIDEVRSWSLEGRSLIVVKARPEIADMDRFRTEIQTEVDNVTDLPIDDDREEPQVREMDFWSQVCTLAISGRSGDQALRNLAEELDDRIRDIQDIGSVIIRGLRDREIQVLVDRNRLAGYDLTLGDLVAAIRGQNVNVAAGTVEPSDSPERAIRLNAKFDSESTTHAVNQIRNLILADRSGRSITISDVADVADALEEEVTRARVNGVPAITIAVSKRRGGNAILLVDQIKAVLKEFQKDVPSDISVEMVEDNSIYIRNRVQTMESSGIIGLALVLLVLWMFINHRLAFLAALGIPISFAGAILFMNLVGMTVNNISLFSMIIVLGMVVDDAIVISENIYRYMEKGYSPVRAAILGTEEVKWPVITTIATSIAAFMPMLMMTGIMGKIMSVIPKVVCMCLIFSLIEALFVLPTHMAEFVVLPSTKKKKPGLRDRWLRAIIARYLEILRTCLRWRYLVVTVAVLVSVIVIVGTLKLTPFILFPSDDIDRFFVRVRAPVGTSLNTLEYQIGEIEKVIFAMPTVMGEIEVITSTIGSRNTPQGGLEYAKHYGQLEIHLVDPSDRDRLADAIMSDMRSTVVPRARQLGVEVEHSLLHAGPPTGKAVSVEVRGDEFILLRKKAEEIKHYLASINGVKEVAVDFELGREEIAFTLSPKDEPFARSLGVTAAMISAELRRAVNGEVATSIESGSEEIDVRVKLPNRQTTRREDLREIQVRTEKGHLIPIKALSDATLQTGYSQITRRDGKRTVTITADVEEGVITSDAVNEKIRKAFPSGEGYGIDLRGEYRDTAESLESLKKAFRVGILVIYLLLGALFKSYSQPLIVMMAIPFAFVGVCVGLLVMGEPQTMMTMIGTVALTGIVVNDSLILVSFINDARQRGTNRWHAILMAGRLRFRPIILTSLTTIFGLLPLAVGMVGVEAFLSPMAYAVVWGLAFSTGLTLVLVPCIYTIVDDIAVYFGYGRFSNPDIAGELDADSLIDENKSRLR